MNKDEVPPLAVAGLTMSDEVIHDEDRSRFVLEDDGHRAVLEYRTSVGDTLDMAHTFVPPEARGGGLGGRLVRGALDWARAHGRRVVPSCSFVAAFIDAHPAYRDLVRGR
jgi:predicted GNAT family acetyltransferase